MKFQAHVINIRKLNESSTTDNDVITKALDSYGSSHEEINITLVSCIVGLYSKITPSSLTWKRLQHPNWEKQNWT
jgi:hypothetical protein